MGLTFSDADQMERKGRQPRHVPDEILAAVRDSFKRQVVKATTGTGKEISALKRDLNRLRKVGWVIESGRRQLGHDLHRLTFRVHSAPESEGDAVSTGEKATTK